jgi:hypothetical protein
MLERYNAAFQELGRGIMPEIKGGKYTVKNIDVDTMMKEINDISQSIVVNKRGETSAKIRREGMPAGAKKYLEENDLDELLDQIYLGNISGDKANEKIDEAAAALEGQLDKTVSDMSVDFKEFMDTQDLSLYSEDEIKILNSFKNVDPETLSEQDKLKYIFYANRVLSTGNMTGAGKIASVINSKILVDKTKPLAGEIKQKLNLFERVFGSRFASKEMIFDMATKTSETAKKLRMSTGIFDLFSKSAEAKKIHEKFIAKYESTIDAWKKKGVNLREPMSIYRRGVYSQLIQTKTNDPETNEQAFEQRKMIIKSDIQQLLNSPNPTQQNKGKLLEAVYNELELDNKTREEFIKEFENKYKPETELVNEAKYFYEKHKNKFKEVIELYNNASFEEWNDYTPTTTERIYGKGEVSDDIKDKTFKFGSNLTPPQSGMSKARIPSKSTNRVYNYDFDNVVSDKALDMLLHAYVQPQYQMVEAAMKNKEMINALGVDLHGILERNLDDKVKSDFGADYLSSDEATKAWNNIVQYLYTSVANTIGSITQLPKQFFSVVLDYGISQGDPQSMQLAFQPAKDALVADSKKRKGKEFRKEGADVLKLLDKFSIGERLRNNPNLEFDIDDRAIEKITLDSKEKAKIAVSNFFKGYNKAILTSLRKSDNAAAVYTWMSEYIKDLKKQGEDIRNIDWAKEAKDPNQAAANAAEQAVSKTQNISDTSLGSRQMTKKEYRAYKMFFFNLASFAINSKLRLYTDVNNFGRAIKNKDGKGVIEGTRRTAGYLTQIATFIAISELLKKSTDVAADFFLSLLGLEDEDELEQALLGAKNEEAQMKGTEVEGMTVIEKEFKDEMDKTRYWRQLGTEVFSEAITSGIVPGDAEALLLKGFNFINGLRYQDEIDAQMDILAKETDPATMKYDDIKDINKEKEEAKRTLKLLINDKDIFAVYGNKGLYGVGSLTIDKFSKLFDKVDASGIESLTDSERRTLNVLIFSDVLSTLGLDEGTLKSIRNKMWKKLERRIQDKYIGREVKIKTKPKYEQIKNTTTFKE